MNTVIIFYPKEFNSFTKFSRKVSRILNNLDSYKVVFETDFRGFISDFFNQKKDEIKAYNVDSWRDEDVTHAIIFDDGNEFGDISNDLKTKGISFRIIKIRITRVINIKKQTEFQGVKNTSDYEYIGRGSYWGNPYSMFEEGDDRDEVIRKYKYDFENDIFPNKKKSEVFKLAGKKLGCFCKPLECHGDVLAEFLNSFDGGD